VHKIFFQDPKSTPSGRKVKDWERKKEEEERKIMPLIVATVFIFNGSFSSWFNENTAYNPNVRVLKIWMVFILQ
jgi:hypothetical protein